METNSDNGFAITHIFLGYINGTNTEQSIYSDVIFKMNSLEDIETIRDKAKKELKKSHKEYLKQHNYKGIEITFIISENPTTIKNAINKHPNKIFQI